MISSSIDSNTWNRILQLINKPSRFPLEFEPQFETVPASSDVIAAFRVNSTVNQNPPIQVIRLALEKNTDVSASVWVTQSVAMEQLTTLKRRRRVGRMTIVCNKWAIVFQLIGRWLSQVIVVRPRSTGRDPCVVESIHQPQFGRVINRISHGLLSLNDAGILSAGILARVGWCWFFTTVISRNQRLVMIVKKWHRAIQLNRFRAFRKIQVREKKNEADIRWKIFFLTWRNLWGSFTHLRNQRSEILATNYTNYSNLKKKTYFSKKM